MRHPGISDTMRLAPIPLCFAVLASLLALSCGGVASAGGSVAKSVTYGGVTVRVPAAWPVYDLAAAPHTCIRYDRPAVFLGRPDAEQDCPAHAIGRTEALLIEPDDAARPDPPSARLRAAALEPDQALTRRLGGVRISASYADDDSQAAAILGSARPASRQQRAADDSEIVRAAPQASDPVPRAEERTRPDALRTRKLEPAATFAGTGFDTCAAPTIATMGVWAAKSPFKAAGVYIGGSDRACPDGNLTPDWVQKADDQGWTLFPIYVGRQAPCWKDPGGANAALIQHGRRWTQGVEAADDAAERAAHFGLSPASAIYFDMEYYPRNNKACTEDVQAFLAAWTDQLHKRGFLSGVYSSASGAVADLAAVYDSQAAYRPDVAWFAHWDSKPTLYGDPTLNDRFWPGHRRIKQFTGGHTESFGGVPVNIDSDVLDAPVAAVN